jgi:hypothetical protein
MNEVRRNKRSIVAANTWSINKFSQEIKELIKRKRVNSTSPYLFQNLSLLAQKINYASKNKKGRTKRNDVSKEQWYSQIEIQFGLGLCARS